MIQYFIQAGSSFPLLGELESILEGATIGATEIGPLRHNAVEAFVEKNTGTNTGSKIPWLDWEILPGKDHVVIDVYMAGGGMHVTRSLYGVDARSRLRRCGRIRS